MGNVSKIIETAKFFLAQRTLALTVTILFFGVSPQVSEAESIPLCWDGTIMANGLDSCPAKPTRLCANGKHVPFDQRYCSLSIVELSILDNPFGQHLNLSVRIEDGEVVEYQPTKESRDFPISIGKTRQNNINLIRQYTDRPSDWESRQNLKSCPGSTCKSVQLLTRKSGENWETITFVELTSFPPNLIKFPEISCIDEQISSHIELHQFGEIPPLSIYC